jgi:hypothetical protein
MTENSKALLGMVLGLLLSSGLCYIVVQYVYNRPLTCEMGLMKACPGGGVQFCQKTHWTKCYEMKVDH